MIANLGWILDFECTYIKRSTKFILNLHIHVYLFIYKYHIRVSADACENKLKK